MARIEFETDYRMAIETYEGGNKYTPRGYVEVMCTDDVDVFWVRLYPGEVKDVVNFLQEWLQEQEEA